MKKFIAIVMVLGLVGFAVAQDLDSPTAGVVDDRPAGGSVFDMIMAQLNGVNEWDRSVWGFTRWQRWQSWQAWEADLFTDVNLRELSAAEQALVADATRNAQRRVLAAGLN